MLGKLSPQSWKIQVVSLLPGVCRNLKSIVVQVGIVDYFKEPHSPEAKKMFEEMVNKLQVKHAGSRSPTRQQPLSLWDLGTNSCALLKSLHRGPFSSLGIS